MKKETKYALGGTAILLLTMAGKLIADLQQWKKGVAVRHTREWLITVPFHASGVMALTYALLVVNGEDLFSWWGLLYFIVSLIAAMGTVWFLFDGLYQIGRGFISGHSELYPFFGLGTIDGKDDANSDSFLRRFSYKTQIYLKVAVLILPIIAYILLLIL